MGSVDAKCTASMRGAGAAQTGSTGAVLARESVVLSVGVFDPEAASCCAFCLTLWQAFLAETIAVSDRLWPRLEVLGQDDVRCIPSPGCARCS
jgi:hypothetical protein